MAAGQLGPRGPPQIWSDRQGGLRKRALLAPDSAEATLEAADFGVCNIPIDRVYSDAGLT